jgi:hypothetical protein
MPPPSSCVALQKVRQQQQQNACDTFAAFKFPASAEELVVPKEADALAMKDKQLLTLVADLQRTKVRKLQQRTELCLQAVATD